MLFLSHSANDREAAVEVRSRLLDRGYHAAQLFLDCDAESGIQAGDRWEDALYGGLRECRALIALCSPRWQQSKWCFSPSWSAPRRWEGGVSDRARAV
jgi:TIR domain